MSDIHGEAFLEEAQELLVALENGLLELERAPGDQELIGQVFRALHTIKGSGAMFGFEDIASFTHEVETVFELVRRGDLPVTQELISLTLAARDQIKLMVEAAHGGPPPLQTDLVRLTAAFQAILPEGEGQGHALEEGPGERQSQGRKTYRIRFRPGADIFRRGVNPLGLLREVCQMGECRAVAQTDAIPPLEEIDPEACYLYWDMILTTHQDHNAIRDVFIFVEDDSEIAVEVIDEEGWLDDTGEYKKLGEILVERGDLTPSDLKKFLTGKKRLGESLVEAGLLNGGKIDSALAEQDRVQSLRKERKTAETASSIRVRSEKLDALVNLVGEMVTVQARLTQTAGHRADAELLAIAEEVERLTWDMRDQILNIRMIPIGTTFSKFNRLVRDLSQELGKDVELVTQGAETELDKTVIERLNDPLVHLIRNCIDHGLESPDKRRKADKPVRGTIFLSAVHSGATVLLQVRDDGAGLNREAIRAKAIEMGLLAADAEIGDKELVNLILAPGFSTAAKVTNVSGRGVGLDVVRKAINDLRGSIAVSSRSGEGTTFSIRLPLTLAIIDGLLVKIEGESFVFPLSAVEECIELKNAGKNRDRGRHLVPVRGELVPYIGLRDHFGMGKDLPEVEQVVIVNVEGHRIGFVVDHVVGEHQTVIKNLGRFYKGLKGLSGATILGDGSVALILDLVQLYREAEVQELSAAEQSAREGRKITGARAPL